MLYLAIYVHSQLFIINMYIQNVFLFIILNLKMDTGFSIVSKMAVLWFVCVSEISHYLQLPPGHTYSK